MANTDAQFIGHFEVLEKLGEGGMGTVYVGLDATLDRRVALKLIRAEHRLDPAHKARFLREARFLSQLDHPGVCQLYDYIEHSEADCLVLELVEGRSLRQVMEEPLERGRALQIITQLIDVLAAVHGQGVVHRDLKPENVMLNPGGTVKVLDFGLAREQKASSNPPARETEQAHDEESAGEGPSDLNSLTNMGSVIGTIGYMSPEQARGEPATAASDMYSFGLIMQELLTGRCPIRRDLSRDARLKRAMWGESDPVSGLPPDLTRLIERLKDLEPAARPAALDAAALLKRARERPRRRRFQVAVAAVVALLTIFGAGMTLQFLRAERERKHAEYQRNRAEHEADTSKQISEFLQGVFEVADPWESRGNTVTARELLDRASARIDLELQGRPLLQARMMGTMGEVYRALGLFDEAAPLLEGAVALQREHFGEDHPEMAIILGLLAMLRYDLGEYEAAESLNREALEMRRRLFGQEHTDLAQGLGDLATVLQTRGDHDTAEELIREAVAMQRNLYPDGHTDLATSI